MTRRAAALVFLTLLCVYAATGGGQGYSVDGTFSYEMATSIATDPSLTFARRNAATLRRWGPLPVVLGVPFAWLGARLGELAPPRDSVTVGGERLALHDWPAVGAPALGGESELRLGLPGDPPGTLEAVRLVSYLSLATQVADGAAVAELALLDRSGQALVRLPIRAGRETAEWAYDVPGAGQAAHARARVAGHWPGNPIANLYSADLPAVVPATVAALLIRPSDGAPAARLHVRAVQLRGARGALELPGPITWSEADQHAFFTRFAFSFVNAPVVALTCALLVPLGRALGYGAGTSTVVALGAGLATPLWPYAKHDFAEPSAALFVVAATLAAVASGGRAGPIATAGVCASLAAAARYTAIWLVPVLALQVALREWLADCGRGAGRVARAVRSTGAFVALPTIGIAAVLLATRRLPTIWSGIGLGLGWLDFPLWNGAYGLLLSPGKGLVWYSPLTLLPAAGAVPFVRRQRAAALVFVVLPLFYVVTYGSKGVWHGGGWGPRYLVPVLPLLACLALPVVESALHRGRARGQAIALGGLAALGVAVQLLGVLKHPNLYTVMFRDHVVAALPDYGHALGGAPALTYWRHFGGPQAGRQLVRPPTGVDPSAPLRGLGYAFAETGTLDVDLDARDAFTLTLYACDWDHRGRRQRVFVDAAAGASTIDLDHDFSDCEYHRARISAPGRARVSVEAIEPRDVPVLSALFFDRTPPDPPAAGDGAWIGRVGRDGYVLLAWDRGADVASLPSYVASVRGGDRVWVDTWQTELAETALLYAPGFSPLLAHGWLLAADAIATLAPDDTALVQRALGSPPWRYVHHLEVHPPHPEYGLGVDLWQVLLRNQFRSHTRVMVVAWATTSLLALAAVAAAIGCLGVVRRATAGRRP